MDQTATSRQGMPERGQSSYVVGLEEQSRLTSGVAGGKAAMLGRLMGAGFPVPAGLCLTTPAFHLAIEPFREQLDEPLWTPLFPVLGALVLDRGALLQHATVTAREYGVPAVIGTGNATTRIPAGSWVTVDGTSGTVQVELTLPDGMIVEDALATGRPEP